MAGQKGVALAKARTSEENRRDSRNMGRSTWYTNQRKQHIQKTSAISTKSMKLGQSLLLTP